MAVKTQANGWGPPHRYRPGSHGLDGDAVQRRSAGVGCDGSRWSRGPPARARRAAPAGRRGPSPPSAAERVGSLTRQAPGLPVILTGYSPRVLGRLGQRPRRRRRPTRAPPQCAAASAGLHPWSLSRPGSPWRVRASAATPTDSQAGGCHRRGNPRASAGLKPQNG